MNEFDKAAGMQGLTVEQFAIKVAHQICQNWDGIPKKLEVFKEHLSVPALRSLEDEMRELCGGRELYQAACEYLRATEIPVTALVVVPVQELGGLNEARLLYVWPNPKKSHFPWGTACEKAGSAEITEIGLHRPSGSGFWLWTGKARYDSTGHVIFDGSYKRADEKGLAELRMICRD